ncbi:putative molybdate transporter 2 [Iris pallida]|uniref:Molybdate transporter 2 n=1 Tax=Iris pallida TaxID=29817 RepID=A0AAX6G1H6_IRIPA|nr:putative molybdate transporter 2 [Iris pallida]
MTKDSSLLPMSLEAMASSIPENSSSTPRIPTGNWPSILTKEFPNSSPSASFPAARNSTDAPLRPPNRYCPASPPAPWQTGIAPNQHPARFISPTLTETAVAETSFSGNRSAESLHTAITELSTDRGICGMAARTNPVFQSSHVILTMPILEGPNLRSLKMEGSRTKQSTKPSRNTSNAAGSTILLLRLRRPGGGGINCSVLLSLSLSSPEPVERTMKSRAERARTRPSRPSQGRGVAVDFPEERFWW